MVPLGFTDSGFVGLLVMALGVVGGPVWLILSLVVGLCNGSQWVMRWVMVGFCGGFGLQ